MYKIIKEYNAETKLAEKDGCFYILKRINLDDVPLIKKLESINNPNVVKFYGTYATENGFYAVEEYINGVTLSDYVERNGALNDGDAVNVALGICNGLKAVHRLGIVHRDINPNNIMLDSYGTVKIIDFGISRTYKAATGSDTHILGTYGYAAPEQYGFTQTSSRADIYSLGVLINYIKTLCLPNERLADEPFGEIVKKCIQIDEKNRFSSVEDIAKALMGKRAVANSIIPGFRKGIFWHKAVASVYYFLFLFVFIIYLVPTNGQTLSFTLFWLSFIFFLLGVPVLIFTDFLDWSKRFSLLKNLNPKQKKIAPIVTGIIYEAAAFLTFIILYMP